MSRGRRRGGRRRRAVAAQLEVRGDRGSGRQRWAIEAKDEAKEERAQRWGQGGSQEAPRGQARPLCGVVPSRMRPWSEAGLVAQVQGRKRCGIRLALIAFASCALKIAAKDAGTVPASLAHAFMAISQEPN